MKVELQPGDYVPTRLIQTEDEYRAIVEAFLAAGAVILEELESLAVAAREGYFLVWDPDGDDELWNYPHVESRWMLRELTPRDALGNQGRYWDAERRADEAHLDGGEQEEE